ncbi:MAG: arylsulfotransferase family protein [Opitutales bacterium]
MNLPRWLSAVYLSLITGFLIGIILMGAEAWPHGSIEQLKAFLAGGKEERDLTFLEKIVNDLDVRPERHLETLSLVEPSEDARPVSVPGLSGKRQMPLVWIHPDAPEGYWVIFGPFDFEDNLHGAILIDHQGRCVHTWQIDFDAIANPEGVNPYLTYPHGFLIQPDASILFGFDNLVSLTRLGAEGNVIWSRSGGHHHALSAADGGYLWAFSGLDLAKFSVDDGKLVKIIRFSAMLRVNNAETDLFGLPSIDTREGSELNLTPEDDPFHPNDVDPLPAAYADAFPQFEAGDLVLSYRDLNLIFVIDAETAKIKWYRHSAFRRQHDPDWLPDGRISVFDNNMHRGWARIAAINPQTYEVETTLPGKPYRFASWHRGKHQVTDDGSHVVTSTVQGRAFMVAPDGQKVFDFYNRYEDDQVLAVSEALWLPSDYFEEDVDFAND